MTSFDMTNIKNLVIQKRFRQVPICDVDFYNVTASQATMIKEGKAQNWYVNGFHQFTGIIKRIDKDDNKPVWHVHSEGAACLLRDTLQESDTIYQGTLVSTICKALLPTFSATKWSLKWNQYGVDYSDCPQGVTEPKLWYHVTPGSCLSHLSNVVRLGKLEWEVDQAIESYDSEGKPKYGDYIFRISTHLGDISANTSYVNNTNAFQLVKKQNQDKVFTSVQAVGSSPESARMTSIITADSNFTKFSTLTTTESYLTNAITATATIIPVADTTWYFPPGLVAIDAEMFTIIGKTATTLTITNTASRGYLSTAAAHPINADVLNLHEFRFSPDASISINGNIVIGSESMTYSNKASGRIYGTIGRNIKGITSAATYAYAHHAGAMVRPRVLIPEYDSYASTSTYGNGLKQTTIDAMGAIDQDGVDLKASIILRTTATSQPYGSFYLTDTDVWKSITLGDRVLLTQAATWIDSTTTVASHDPTDGSTHYLYNVPCKIKATPEVIDTRLIGVTWNQYKPVLLEYGDVDMFILDDFANANKAYNTAINRNANTTQATVLTVSATDSTQVLLRLGGSIGDVWAKKV
jgi:hypothetical protein